MKSAIRSVGTRLSGAASWIYRKFLKRAVGHTEFRKIVAEFFLEVGVLWFVFPVLDTIVQFGSRKVTVKLTVLSTGIAVGCLYVAGWFSPNDPGKE